MLGGVILAAGKEDVDSPIVLIKTGETERELSQNKEG